MMMLNICVCVFGERMVNDEGTVGEKEGID